MNFEVICNSSWQVIEWECQMCYTVMCIYIDVKNKIEIQLKTRRDLLKKEYECNFDLSI